MYKPREVVVETTRQCNLNCMHCGSDCSCATMENELSIEEWQDIFAQLSEMGTEKIVFSGGEPTLKKGFERLLLFASKPGVKVSFISNGLLLFSESLRESISQSKPFAIGLSIDGLKETHNKIRRNPASWQGLMRNISLLQELSIQICAITTLHKLNYQELPRLAEFLSLAEIDSWQIQLAMLSGRMATQRNLILTEAKFQEACREILLFRSMYPQLNVQAADCFGLAPKGSIRSNSWSGCTAGISSMGIDACGNIMPCLSLQETKGENLKGKSVSEVWQNSSVFDFNRRFNVKDMGELCKDCGFSSECRGGCNSQSYSYCSQFHNSPFCFARSFQLLPS